MLTQQINRYSPPKARIKYYKGPKPRFISGSDEHRRHIFLNTLDQVFTNGTFEVGDPVVCRRGPKKEGVIISIEEEFELIYWEGLKACFIEVYLYNTNEIELFHPSDLKVRKDV